MESKNLPGILEAPFKEAAAVQMEQVKEVKF